MVSDGGDIVEEKLNTQILSDDTNTIGSIDFDELMSEIRM